MCYRACVIWGTCKNADPDPTLETVISRGVGQGILKTKPKTPWVILMYSEDGEPLCSCDYLFPHVSLTESVNAKSRYYARLGRIPVPIPGPDTRWQLRYFFERMCEETYRSQEC